MVKNDNFIQRKLYGFDKYFIDFCKMIENQNELEIQKNLNEQNFEIVTEILK